MLDQEAVSLGIGKNVKMKQMSFDFNVCAKKVENEYISYHFPYYHQQMSSL